MVQERSIRSRSMTTAQKIGVAFALLLVVAYLGYVSVRENGIRALRDTIVGTVAESPTPTLSDSPSPLASPQFTPTPTIVVVTPSPVVTAGASVLGAMNAQRNSAGVPSCVSQATLHALAQSYASDMAQRGYFSHTNPDGKTFEQRIVESGYAGTLNAENLGLTSGAAVEVVAGWMDSSGHRTNLLNPQLTACGVGTATGTWQGMSVSFVVAIFGNVN